MNGGYQMLDLKATAFTTNGAGKTIKGIYDKIEGTHKPTMVGNFILDDIEKSSRFVVFGNNEGTFEGGLGYAADGSILYIRVTSDDLITIANV